jgi:hypothetical protein
LCSRDSLRTRRRAARDIRRHLAPELGALKATAFAKAIAHADPDAPMGAAAAHRELRALNVRLSRSSLYRLAKRSRLCTGALEVLIDTSGRWGAEESRTPVARIIVRFVDYSHHRYLFRVLPV